MPISSRLWSVGSNRSCAPSKRASSRRRLLEFERQRDELKVGGVPAAPSMPRLHPGLAELYQRKVTKLEQTLNEPDSRAEAAKVLPGLINRIVIKPARDDSGFVAKLYGGLSAVLALGGKKTNTPGTRSAGVQVSLVAGTDLTFAEHDFSTAAGSGCGRAGSHARADCAIPSENRPRG